MGGDATTGRPASVGDTIEVATVTIEADGFGIRAAVGWAAATVTSADARDVTAGLSCPLPDDTEPLYEALTQPGHPAELQGWRWPA